MRVQDTAGGRDHPALTTTHSLAAVHLSWLDLPRSSLDKLPLDSHAVPGPVGVGRNCTSLARHKNDSADEPSVAACSPHCGWEMTQKISLTGISNYLERSPLHRSGKAFSLVWICSNTRNRSIQKCRGRYGRLQSFIVPCSAPSAMVLRRLSAL